MRNDLLGYLLGALDGPEHDGVRSCLATDAKLCKQLEELESDLAPLERLRWEYDPPPGLAQATCQVVASRVENKVVPRSATAGFSPRREVSQSRRGWDLLDVVVAAGIFMAASMLFFPAIANSRHQSQMMVCQHKLRTLGLAFQTWADGASGKLPSIPLGGKMGVAGFYAPLLKAANIAPNQHVFLCPSSAIAQQLARQKTAWVVPSIAAIQTARGSKLVELQRRMGGSYCYNLGHFENGIYQPTQLRGRANFALLSDQVENGRGPHGSHGINVLFEDGGVRCLVICPKAADPTQVEQQWDQLFVSDRGLVEAGCNSDDVVLAPSWARPNPLAVDAPATEQLLEF